MPQMDGTLSGFPGVDAWDQVTGLLLTVENDLPRFRAALVRWREGPDTGKRVWMEKTEITYENPGP